MIPAESTITSVAVDQTGFHIGIGEQNGKVIIYQYNYDEG